LVLAERTGQVVVESADLLVMQLQFLQRRL
jgi:hypothetical protein